MWLCTYLFKFGENVPVLLNWKLYDSTDNNWQKTLSFINCKYLSWLNENFNHFFILLFGLFVFYITNVAQKLEILMII